MSSFARFVGRIPLVRKWFARPARKPVPAAAPAAIVPHAPTLAGAHSNLAAALQWHGKLGEAVAANRKAIACDPTYAPAYRNLGLCLSAQRKWEGAVAPRANSPCTR